MFRYHPICQNKTEVLCFHEPMYFCVCQVDRYRAECFGHNPLIDQYDFCLSKGECVKGDLYDPSNFLCLCPHCYEGQLCEFNMKAFGFTIDSLFIEDTSFVKTVYIGLVFLIVAIGLFTNYFVPLPLSNDLHQENSASVTTSLLSLFSISVLSRAFS